MEAGEFWIGRFLLVIVFTGINAAIKIGEQLRNRLNALVVLTGGRIQGFRFVDIARFHRIRKGFGSRCQVCRLFDDIRFISGDGIAQAQQGRAFRGIRCGIPLNDELTFRVGQQTAGHVIFTRLQVSRHFLAKARRDIFALFHDHHAFENFPLQRFLAVVLNNKLCLTAVDRNGHRLTLLIIHRHLDLWNISSLSGEGRSNKRCHTNL